MAAIRDSLGDLGREIVLFGYSLSSLFKAHFRGQVSFTFVDLADRID